VNPDQRRLRRQRQAHRHDTVPFMTTPFTAALATRLTRAMVLCLLAIVLPLQGAAAAAFSAIGPAHVHKAEATPLVLEDLRRWRPAPVAQAHVFTALGHFHASAAPQRHHHATDDASTVRTEANGPDADEALSVSSVPLLAPIPAVQTWQPLRAATAPDAGPLWALRTGFRGRLDRPPQRG
jgi:hypothetical protein